MSIILIAIFILFLIKLLRDSLFFVWFWQVKEYRVDRIKSHLKEERKIIKNNIFYLIALFLILIFYFIQQIFIYLTLLFFTFTFLQILREVKNRTLKRPKLTFKILLIFFIMIIFYLLFFVIYWIPVSAGMTNSLILLLLFFYLITPILITVIILFVNPFFNFQKKRIIKRATVKMRNLKKIKVIGITGSYGKTSTKEFLYAVLKEKYKVVKTQGNNNTNIGVAYTVLNKVSDDYDYFICEMGAYKIGEIKEMCSVTSPEIGILTGINEQHLELFGSIENTRKAKLELIESLPENGLAVINSGIMNYELRIKVKNIKYFSVDNNVENIKVYQDYVEFDFQNQKFKANLLGRHYIENILSAIMVAEYLGMNLEEIKNAIEKIELSKFMMRRSEGLNDSVFIDDSYSANPDGVIAALDYLDEAYQGYQKIIVFPGIIELGNRSKEVHRKLFNRIDEVCDVAYVMSRKFVKLKVHILSDENNCKFVFEKDFDKVASMLKKDLDKNAVVLFESRGAGVVMKKILS